MEMLTETLREVINSPVAIDKSSARLHAGRMIDSIMQQGGGVIKTKLVSTNLDAVADEMKCMLAERALSILVEKELEATHAPQQ